MIGVDPGSNAPYSVRLETLQAETNPLRIGNGGEYVLVEGQYPRPKSSRQSLMTLSFYAGLHAGSYLEQGATVYVLTPKQWKPVHLGRGSDRLPKQVYQNKARALVPDKIWKLGPDATDAYLIGEAGRILLSKGKKLEELKWTK